MQTLIEVAASWQVDGGVHFGDFLEQIEVPPSDVKTVISQAQVSDFYGGCICLIVVALKDGNFCYGEVDNTPMVFYGSKDPPRTVTVRDASFEHLVWSAIDHGYRDMLGLTQVRKPDNYDYQRET